MIHYRPLCQTGAARPAGAQTLAGGWCWFTHAEALERGGAPRVVPAATLPGDVLDRLTAPRAAIAGLGMDAPRIMAILNITPDSFSDGGRHAAPDAARDGAARAAEAGADLLDVGGESTRPGATPVPEAEEAARVLPALAAICEVWSGPVSVDTRKAGVAAAALEGGAAMVNDVSALSFDPDMAGTVAASGAALCLMHAQGDPQTMQDAPVYDDVLLDVYDHLEARIAAAEAAGIARSRIVVDPGIGFGKTVAHNLTLLRGLSLLHGLGCPILLGVSRKGFIGALGGGVPADARLPGSLAVALAGLAQGVQVLRVHDTGETAQAVRLWRSVTGGIEP